MVLFPDQDYGWPLSATGTEYESKLKSTTG